MFFFHHLLYLSFDEDRAIYLKKQVRLLFEVMKIKDLVIFTGWRLV